GCRFLFAHEKAGDEDHYQRGYQHHGGDRVDLRGDAAPDRGEDVDGQRGVRPGDEEGDDEIVEGKGEGKQEAGEDRRPYLRQHDLVERGQRRRVEVVRGFDDVATEAGDARFHDHGDE